MALFSSSSRSDVRDNLINAAETLFANIRFMEVDEPKKSIVITSSVPNEGKTFLSIALASAIADSGKKVLLIEADMRRRSLSKELGAHAKYGIYAVVSGRIPLVEAAIPTSVKNLFFLDAEPHIPNPSDFINSKHFKAFIKEAGTVYDYVLFDTPPVGTFVDAAVLGSACDFTLLVVRENLVRKKELASAVEQLKKADCELGGLVMNYCDAQSNDYYYSHYYRQDKRGDKDAPKLISILGNQQADLDASKQAVPSKPSRARFKS